MKTTKPLTGLLLYFWYSAGGKLIILFVQILAWGVAFLIFGESGAGPFIYALFGINAVMGVSLTIIVGMGNKEIDWERFQLSMPVKRHHLASSQYISVGLAPLAGIPIFLIFTGLSLVLHDGTYLTFLSMFNSTAPYLAMPYIKAALVFPIYAIPAVEKIHDALFPIVMVTAMAIPLLIMHAARRLDWSITMASVIALAVAAVMFIVSYFITRKIYAKSDF